MASFDVTIQTPTMMQREGNVESLVAPGLDGLIGVMARHHPMVAAVGTGVLKLRRNRQETYYVVGEGAMEVRGDVVTLLCDAVIPATGPADAEDKAERYLRQVGQPPVLADSVAATVR
ncbi:MAG: hypothetical protein A2340_14590 [Lentisphaerae bacterium RIFOXYB12_FULL_60_10]|nr:MAG: hypothetical protein A2269_00445 [Lentisphaerae bacterium RIFOXYA12_FULL_60_10]OGV75069.1 MAG: hypothetical protein A2340_14590 [Lentisphaerae bacterium RIFOXYB12_FULL_60_10]